MKLLILVLAALGTTLGVPHKLRIYGGDAASPGQFPFIVSINDQSQFCDGSIINKNWVLTAGHCVLDVSNTTTIRAGTNLLDSGGTEFKVKNWVLHDSYDYSNYHNDIGLIQIEGEFAFTDLVQPAEFFEVGANSTCYAAGWGETQTVNFPEELQFVELTAFSLEDCTEMAGEYLDGLYLGEEQVCAGGPKGKGACYGDSGGPLVCDGKLAGVVSYAFLPCAEGVPDVYTRPTHYTDWIDKNVNN